MHLSGWDGDSLLAPKREPLPDLIAQRGRQPHTDELLRVERPVEDRHAALGLDRAADLQGMAAPQAKAPVFGSTAAGAQGKAVLKPDPLSAL